MEDAEDWLIERTVTYWSSVFDDDWKHWFDRKHSEYDEGVGVDRREERLKALSVLLERGLALEGSGSWDRKGHGWVLGEEARVGALRDRRPR